jgi:hypothetical protein
MADNSWRNLAEDAVNDIFKDFVGQQLVQVLREQIDIATFMNNVMSARQKRDAVIAAIDA